MSKPFSDYIVYVDESGDHGLESIDHNYSVFVLAFCVFTKEAYVESVAPAIQRFKFRHFGHDMAILHEKCVWWTRTARGIAAGTCGIFTPGTGRMAGRPVPG